MRFSDSGVVTPPDVLSQTLLAVPMYLLFELGVLLSNFYVGKGRRDRENNEEDDEEKEES